MATNRTFKDINGAPFDGAQFIPKHSLIIDPPFLLPDAGWIARATGFYEMARSTRHTVSYNDMQINSRDMGIAWWFESVDDRDPLPTSYNSNTAKNKSLSRTVIFDLASASAGIQIDAQTVNSDPGYIMWVHGIFQGKKIMSEAVHIGAISNHTTLGVHWDLEAVSGSNPNPLPNPVPNPTPVGTDLKTRVATEMSLIEQSTYRIRNILNGN